MKTVRFARFQTSSDNTIETSRAGRPDDPALIPPNGQWLAGIHAEKIE
jgi:hypothetical protein